MFKRETPSPRSGTKPRRTGSKDTPVAAWVTPRKTPDGAFNHTEVTAHLSPRKTGDHLKNDIPKRSQPRMSSGRATPRPKLWNLKDGK